MRCFFLAFLLVITFPSSLSALDWPMFGGDAERSRYTEETLPTDLSLSWVYHSRHAPQPAWLGPDTRMTFDYAYHTVIADGTLFWGSSADCKVYALDAVTGQELWSFFTGAPVRLAPVVWGNLVFVASDDGYIYAVSFEDGSLIWKRRGGPDGRMVLGNDRMISRWPARGGPVIRDAVLYAAAGIWPTDGIYVYALQPATGEIIWCNDSSGDIEMDQPHSTAVAKSGISAQGYLAAAEEHLVVPTGRAVPAGLKRADGTFDYFYLQENQHRGGSRFTVLGEIFMNDDYAFYTENGTSAFQVSGTSFAGFPEGFVQATASQISATTVSINVIIRGERRTLRARRTKLWSVGAEHAGVSLIVASDTIVSGGNNQITLLKRENGEVLWSATVDGIPYGLAVANGRLYVSTDRGAIYCFAADEVDSPVLHEPQTDAAPYGDNTDFAQAAEEILAQTGVTEGYCLDLGCGDGALAYELAQRSNLQIYAVDDDPQNVALARSRLDAAGLYGVRVTVHLADPAYTLYPDYFTNLIVSGRSVSQGQSVVPVEEMQRLQRPYGGVTCIGRPGEMVQTTRGPLEGAGEWTHQYANPGNTTCSTDRIAKSPLGMLWFRDPDLPMPQRHGRGPAPLFYHGRMFVEGLNSVRAVDAYNGRTLWEYPLDGILSPYDQEHLMGTAGTNSNYCVADGSLYIHTKDRCLRLDAVTGVRITEYPTPDNQDGASGKWGYIACVDGTLYGTLVDEEHIVKWSYQAGDMSQQFTESKALFALDVETGTQKWIYSASDSIRHNAIAVGGGRVFLIDRPVADEDRLARRKRRGIKALEPIGKLAALDTASGEILWATTENIFGTLLEFSETHDALLMSYQPSRFNLPSELSSWMAVYRGSSGELVWNNKERLPYVNRPMINGRTIYAEPLAVDLLTGEKLSFRFSRSYACGTISGSPNLLVFRSATIGYRDLTVDDSQTENFGGCRPGCWINTLPVGGLILMSNATSGCTCSYLMHATMALQEDKGSPEPFAGIDAFAHY